MSASDEEESLQVIPLEVLWEVSRGCDGELYGLVTDCLETRFDFVDEDTVLLVSINEMRKMYEARKSKALQAGQQDEGYYLAFWFDDDEDDKENKIFDWYIFSGSELASLELKKPWLH